MKKFLSIVLAAIMTVSVFAITTVPVMAESVLSPTADVKPKKPTLQVNGSITTTDINYSPDKNNSSVITFTYTGEGSIYGWEDNLADLGLIEGTDYTATYNEDGTYTITFISQEAIDSWKNGDVLVNALVKIDNTKPDNGNGSNKSPDTGVATSAISATVAGAGAGLAVLIAKKKKDAE